MHELSIATHVVATLTEGLSERPGWIKAVRRDFGALADKDRDQSTN